MKIILTISLTLLSMATLVFAQEKLSASSVTLSAGTSTREQDGLNGPVRRVRIESAKLLVKEGKTVESPRVLREITTYAPKGEKIDSVAYPVDTNTLTGKEQYQYDNNGNIIEMVLRAADGAVLSKERYEYESDQFGNWKRMTTAIAVYEDGNVTYEPVEITYRTITYYFSDAVTKRSSAGTAASTVSPAIGDANLARTGKPKPDRPNMTSSSEPKTATNEPKKPASEPTPVRKSEETIPSANVAATAKESAKVPVLHVPEDVLRKAAIELPDPELPPEIASAQFEGNVEVQLIVDERGQVAAVRAISGNPLLMEAATRAGLRARFSPTALSTQPAKVFGVLTYTFPSRKVSAENAIQSQTGEPTNNTALGRSEQISSESNSAITAKANPATEETSARNLTDPTPQPERKPEPAVEKSDKTTSVANSSRTIANLSTPPEERKPEPAVEKSDKTSDAANSSRTVANPSTPPEERKPEPAVEKGDKTTSVANSSRTVANPSTPPMERKPESVVEKSDKTSGAGNSSSFAPEKKLNSVVENSANKPVTTASTTPVSNSPGSRSVASPRPFATPFEKGMASLATGKYAAAADYFNQAIKADSTDALAYCRLGLSYSIMNKHKDAIAAYKQAIRLRRAFVDVDSYYRLGTAYIEVGDGSAAIDPLKQALYMIRAQVLDTEQRKPASATPPQADVSYALGLAYYDNGAFRNAATEFENAIRLKQDFASAYLGLGLSQLNYGDRRSAEKQEQILRKMKSPLADKLADQIVMPGPRRNRVF